MTTLKHCPGYPSPFAALVDKSVVTAYPNDKFRVEWGPIFHRGRLDGTAQVLCIGQDPAAHETFVRRILVGEAGQRVQGFLKKIGITRHYVMINASLYSEYGSGAAITNHVESSPDVAAERAPWIAAILAPKKVKLVLLFGGQAKACWTNYTAAHGGAPAGGAVVELAHPTSDSYGADGPQKLVDSWNNALKLIEPAPFHDVTPDFTQYAVATYTAQVTEIPDFDLPAGLPTWMRALDTWAVRPDPAKVPDPSPPTPYKRAHLLVTVPATEIP